MPARPRTPASRKRSGRSGIESVRRPPTSTPGIEPSRSQAEDLEVDVAGRPVRRPGDVQKGSGVKDVRADDLVGAQREDDEERQPEEDPAPHGRQADDEPAEDADEDGRGAVTPAEHPPCVAGRLLLDEALRDQPDCPEEERAAEHLPHHRLDVFAIALGQLDVDPHAEQRRGCRPEEHPPGQPRPNVPHPPVLNGADALERGAVGDVRADRRRRRHAEEEDQQRRHQRAAAHACHSHEHSRQQPEQGVLPGHGASCFCTPRSEPPRPRGA